MNRGMLIHKFGYSRAPARPVIPPRAYKWLYNNQMTYKPRRINPTTIEVFAQQDIIVNPNGNANVTLEVGIEMAFGKVLVSFHQHIRDRGITVENILVPDNIENIMITLRNSSSNIVEMKAGEPICYLIYV